MTHPQKRNNDIGPWTSIAVALSIASVGISVIGAAEACTEDNDMFPRNAWLSIYAVLTVLHIVTYIYAQIECRQTDPALDCILQTNAWTVMFVLGAIIFEDTVGLEGLQLLLIHLISVITTLPACVAAIVHRNRA